MLIKSRCCRPFGLWTTIKHPQRRNAGARARLTGNCVNHLHMLLHQYLQCQFFFLDHWYLPFPRPNSTAFLFVPCMFTSRACRIRYPSFLSHCLLAPRHRRTSPPASCVQYAATLLLIPMRVRRLPSILLSRAQWSHRVFWA